MKTTNAALILAKQNDEFNQRNADAFNQYREERDKYTLSEYQLDAVIGELLDTFDQHFIEAAVNFRRNLNATEGNWSKHPYLEKFVGKLKPYARFIEERLRSALADKYPAADLLGEPDSDLTGMISDVEETAYIIGIFMGARLAGAPAERLNLIRKHLIF